MCWASDELACEATPCFLTVRAAGAQPDARKITASQQAGAMAKAKAAVAAEPSWSARLKTCQASLAARPEQEAGRCAAKLATLGEQHRYFMRPL